MPINVLLRPFICLSLFMMVLVNPVTGIAQDNGNQNKDKRVVIIIDDFGNNMDASEEIINMPVPLTIAVMPFLSTTTRDAEWAYRKGHDVIVHLPMEPNRGRKEWLGPGAITTDLSDKEIRKRVLAAIENVPHAIGINNHMGSKATADLRVMRIILQICREKGLIYIDSKTNYWSVAAKLAKQLEVPYAENNIFLDDENNKGHIFKQCQLVKEYLSTHNLCIAIGHVGRPGKRTAAVLREEIPKIQKVATFIKTSDLFKFNLVLE